MESGNWRPGAASAASSPLSAPLRRCLAGLFASLDGAGIPYAVLALPRAHTLPPVLSVLTLRESYARADELSRTAAAMNDAVASSRRYGDELLLAFLDPVRREEDGRRWLLLRLTDRLVGPQGKTLALRDMERGRRRVADVEFSVPDRSWSVLLGVLDLLPGSAQDGGRWLQEELAATEDDAHALCAEHLGGEAWTRLVAAARGSESAFREALAACRRGLHRTAAFAAARPLPMPRRPVFFVVSGAHGVGKSATVAECVRTLDALALGATPFHHILDTRTSGEGGGEGTRASSVADRVPSLAAGASSVPRPLRRLLSRLVPASVKLVLVSLADEARYLHRIRALLRRAHAAGTFAVGDRYVYDRWVDLRLRHRPTAQVAAVRLAGSLLPHPRLVFQLVDEPTAIRKRKPELEVDEIRRYQEDLAGLCARLGVPYAEIHVGGRPPETVAAEAVRRMLLALGEEVFSFLRWGPGEGDGGGPSSATGRPSPE